MSRAKSIVVGIDEAGRAAKRLASSAKIIVGIDEAGRGPLAGPITVAAIAVMSEKWGVPSVKCLAGIKDSKKLSPKKREEWYKKLHGDSAYIIAHSSVSASLIDRCGITFAAHLAVARCLKKISINYKLQTTNSKILLDGSLFAPKEYRQRTIIKGDEKIPLIAAASIIAKVTRDRKMKRLHKKYPQYGFAIHKGYGTRAHFAAIRKYGFSDIHRKSFCTKLI